MYMLNLLISGIVGLSAGILFGIGYNTENEETGFKIMVLVGIMLAGYVYARFISHKFD